MLYYNIKCDLDDGDTVGCHAGLNANYSLIRSFKDNLLIMYDFSKSNDKIKTTTELNRLTDVDRPQ